LGCVGFDIYLITDRRLAPGGGAGGAGGPGGLARALEEALSGGIKGVQLREKDLAGGELFTLAVRMRELTSRFGAKLLINDRVDIALAVDADGVHLGRNSFPPEEAREIVGDGKLIGVSTHSVEEAIEAERAKADFITFGPVYFTPSKAGFGEPVGLGALKKASRELKIPVFAIGGIKRDNINEVVSSGGAFGVAVISAVLASGDLKRSSEELIRALKASKGQTVA
jgi:thiamine-phosphate pyrophosphorylase